MEILVRRKIFTDKSTVGEMLLNNTFFCYTLEDVVRASKIPGETAISVGRYKVVVDFSPKFQKNMFHVLGTPGFEGIRIHPGNTDKDTEGCILVGTMKAPDKILNSKVAFQKLWDTLTKDGLMKEETWLTVTNEGIRNV